MAKANGWAFTMDEDGDLVIFDCGRTVFEGSYEAFQADGDIKAPAALVQQIHNRWNQLFGDAGPTDVCDGEPD
jgi:hypothetical protein